jgi:hypothetical protein
LPFTPKVPSQIPACRFSIRIRAYDGGATSLADALRYEGNLRWDDSLMHLYRAGKIPEDVFKANAMVYGS